MKIVIDARMYGLEHAGIGRYIINLISQIEILDRKNEYIVLLRKKYFQKLSFKNKKFKKVLADYPHYSFKEQFFLPLQLIKLKPDLVHFPHLNVPAFWWGKQIVTVHDLIKNQWRGIETTTKGLPFYWFKYLNYRILVLLAIKRVAKIITPSNWWREYLIKQYELPSQKIIVTYEGVSRKFMEFKIKDSAPKIIRNYGIRKPFVIYTGSLYPHKNVLRLVEAVKLLNLQGLNLQLVIVCARNVFFNRFKIKVEKLEAEKFVKLLGFLPDEEIAALYQEAEAFVFPSLLEGFGLPGLEAMAIGAPVLAARASCLPEIYKDAALYFDPFSPKDMGEKISLVIKNEDIRKKLIDAGRKRVKSFSWQRMAEQTLKIYEQVGRLK